MQKLNQIGSVWSGYTFRDTLEFKECGLIRVIQPKNLKCIYEAPRIDLFQNYERYLLNSGDILISIKGSNNTITRLTLPNEAKYVCTAAFAVVRSHELKTCSSFLSWYLQCEVAQEALRAMQKGTTVQNLSLKDLQDLPIPSLPLNMQRTIGELADLEQKRASTSQELASKRKLLLDLELLELTKGEAKMDKENAMQKTFDRHLWEIFNRFRGVLSAESAFSLLLQLLFYKFLEDNRDDIQIEQRSLQLNFPQRYLFSGLMLSNENMLSETLSRALQSLEEINDPLLAGIFMQSDLSYLDRRYDRQAGRLLLELISVINTLNFNKKYLSREGTAFSAIFAGLLDKYTESEPRRGGSFAVPKSLRELLARLSHISSRPEETVYDPVCGTGALLMDVVRYAESSPDNLTTAFAQERNMNSLSLAKMQWIINGQDPSHIAVGDALRHPQFTRNGNLQQFDKVVSCPPFGMGGWGADQAASDPYHRYDWGIPPASRADYAYILHAIASLNSTGSAFLVSIAGVLFRGGAEAQIRKKMIEDDIISAVISLPAGIFNLWNIPLCILCLSKADKRQPKGILMIDLASYPNQVRDKAGLSASTIHATIESVKEFFDNQRVATQHEIFSKIVTKEQLAANDYNLNIARYFADGGKKAPLDVAILSNEIIQLEKELSALDLKIRDLKEQLKIS